MYSWLSLAVVHQKSSSDVASAFRNFPLLTSFSIILDAEKEKTVFLGNFFV
jgi:hypothetical protein